MKLKWLQRPMLERFGEALGVMLDLKSATLWPKLRLEVVKNEVKEALEKKISETSKKPRAGRPPDGKNRGVVVVNETLLDPT